MDDDDIPAFALSDYDVFRAMMRHETDIVSMAPIEEYDLTVVIEEVDEKMAWYCPHCQRYVESSEVDVGNVRVGQWRSGNMAFHRHCLQPVRAEKDDAEARTETREGGSDE